MQPIIIEDTISIAAGAVNENVIASNPSLSRYRRAPFPARGKLVAVFSDGASSRIQFDYGSRNVVGSSRLRTATNMQEPDDVVNDDWYVEEGDELILRANNAGGAAVDLRYRIALDPWEGELPPDMRVIQGDNTIAAGAVDTQVLAGTRYERPPTDSLLTVWTVASAAGLLRSIDVDVDNIAPRSAVKLGNRIPIDPFDISVTGIEAPADKQISLSFSNPTGGSLVANWKVALKELYRK